MASAQRVSQILTENGWNQSDLARRLEISPQSVQYWVSGKTSPRGKSLSALSDLTGYPEHWFFMESSEADSVNMVKPKPHIPNVYRVEVLDVHASAGPGVVIPSDFIETVTAIEYTTEQARILFGGRQQEVIKIITIDGDSMLGTIDPGDQVFVDISINSLSGDGIYIFVYGDTLHIKRLQMQGERLAVLSDNKKYETWYIDGSNEYKLHIMAKVLIGQSIQYRRFA